MTEQVPAPPPVVAVVQVAALKAAPVPGALKLKVVAVAVFKLPLASLAVTVMVYASEPLAIFGPLLMATREPVAVTAAAVKLPTTGLVPPTLTPPKVAVTE